MDRPDAYGGYLLIVGALTLPQVFSKKPVLPRTVVLVCMSLIALALMLSVSRGAMLGLALVAMLIGLLRYRRLLVLMAVVVLMALILPQTRALVEHFAAGFAGQDLATQMRFGEYKDALELISRYPVLGVGFIGTPDVDLYIGVSSMYLLVAQQMGLLGLLAFALVFVGLFIGALKAWPAVRNNERLSAIFIGAHGAVIGALFTGIRPLLFQHRLSQFGHAVVVGDCSGCGDTAGCAGFRRLTTGDDGFVLNSQFFILKFPFSILSADCYNPRNMQMLELEVQSLKKVDVVKLKGRIDSSNVSAFEEAVNQLLQQGRYNLGPDMEKLDYMSSAGLRTMVAALKVSKNKGGNVVIAQPNERMVDTLKLVGFHTLFPQYGDVLQAVDSF